MEIFYYICDFLNTAAQVWLILQLVRGIFEAKPNGKWVYIGQAALILAVALGKVQNDFTYRVLFSNGMVLLSAFLLSLGIRVYCKCKFWEAFSLNLLGWIALSLMDFFVQTCVYLGMEKLGGRKDILLSVGMARGCYLLLGAALAVLAGCMLRRRLSGKRQEAAGYWLRWRGKLAMLNIPLAVCAVYFQRIYLHVASGELLNRWWSFIVGAAMMVILFLMYNVWQRAEGERRLWQMKAGMLEGNYRELLQMQEEKAILAHDMRNHMLAIGRMAESGQWEGIRAYTEQVTEALRQGRDRVWTDHKMLDLILNMKFQEAEQAQVKVRCECDDMGGLLLTQMELCALFANLLDNAVEANERRPEGLEREMEVICRRHEQMLIVTVSNRFWEEESRVRRLFGTAKEDKKAHGFGMKSIQSVVDRYAGYMKVSTEGDIYTVRVCIRAFGE